MNVTDKQTTDGRATVYSERELFTFAKNYNCVGNWATMWHRLHNRLDTFTQIISFYPMIIFCSKDGGSWSVDLSSGVGSQFLSCGGGV